MAEESGGGSARLRRTAAASTSATSVSTRTTTEATWAVRAPRGGAAAISRGGPGPLAGACTNPAGAGEAGAAGEEDRSLVVFSGGNKRKDETSRVLVYNSYIYPTLGTEQYRLTPTQHLNFIITFFY